MILSPINNLNDIIGQSHVIKSCRTFIQTKTMPHLLFYGPSGVGKSSVINALSIELFGIDNYINQIIKINACEDKGINFIRDKIKKYAAEVSMACANSVCWKIIIIEDSDILTIDSQYALSAIMENYTAITRFCIICNDINKIIQSLQSRCSIYKFNYINCLELSKTFNNLEHIDTIIKLSHGDLRKATNIVNSENNNLENIILPQEIINLVFQCKSIKDCMRVSDIIYQNGYCIRNLIHILYNHSLTISDTISRKELQFVLLNEINHLDSNEHISIYKLISSII